MHMTWMLKLFPFREGYEETGKAGSVQCIVRVMAPWQRAAPKSRLRLRLRGQRRRWARSLERARNIFRSLAVAATAPPPPGKR